MSFFDGKRPMDLHALLNAAREDLVADLVRRLGAPGSARYAQMDPAELGLRARRLVDALLAAVGEGLTSLVHHIEGIASERIAEGFSLGDVQRALNVLEERAWREVVQKAPLTDQATFLARITTAVGLSKDRLARLYLLHVHRELTMHRRHDPQDLFKGTVSGPMEEDEGLTTAQ